MEQHTITQEKVNLKVADGSEMTACVSRPREAGPYAAVIVLQEAFGVNDHIRDVADRFARQGYLAIAPELFHRTAPGFEGNYEDFPSVMPHVRAVTPETAEPDLHAVFDWLTARPDVRPKQIYAVGFCLGGTISFLANAVLPLAASASFYGRGIAQDLLGRAGDLNAPILLFWGGLDKNILAEHRRAVVDALKEKQKEYVNVEFSKADHAFFNDARPSYDARAAEQSWAVLMEFMRSE